jgi:hypothetical protein
VIGDTVLKKSEARTKRRPPKYNLGLEISFFFLSCLKIDLL